jgi:hypothetical protein
MSGMRSTTATDLVRAMRRALRPGAPSRPSSLSAPIAFAVKAARQLEGAAAHDASAVSMHARLRVG